MGYPTNLLDAVKHWKNHPSGDANWKELCAEKIAELEQQVLQLKARLDDKEPKPVKSEKPARVNVAELQKADEKFGRLD